MKLLTSQEAAKLLGLKPNTLEIWRWRGCGPSYRKVGRLVRYAEADVFDWLDGQKRQNTSQQADHTRRT
jgi:excisionase family DNA binding protein